MSTVEQRELLPTEVRPLHYSLRLEPEMDSSTTASTGTEGETYQYQGQETVLLRVLRPGIRTLTLNAKELDIRSVSVSVKSSGLTLSASSISYDSAKDRVTFHFDQDLPMSRQAVTASATAMDPTTTTTTSTATTDPTTTTTTSTATADQYYENDDSLCLLQIQFQGTLNDKMVGFYRSAYTLPDGRKRFYATTQFEATDARRAFPCWDEPVLKAIFSVTLVVPDDRVALSNMPELYVKSIPGSGKKEVRFQDTPLLSTYLLAFIVGDFDFVEGLTSSGTLVRVYTPVGKKEQGSFSLEVALRVLPWYEQFFQVPFPLPKVWLVSIPDFSAGAMENHGCITFRETALLVDPTNTSIQSKQWVALVVSHELGHSWFGNMVTMEWWEHLWLNEGFATWIEYLVVDNLYPEWHIFEQFVQTEFTRAQSLDALESSHPIEVPVFVASEIDQIFDLISYSKGCAVIRMLASWLGLDTFKAGLRIYIRRYLHRNAATTDLWQCLSEASKQDVGPMMISWTRQMGYPVVTVKEDHLNADGSITLSLEQRRFLDSGFKEDDKSLWHIPLGYMTSSDPKNTKLVLLKDRVSSLTIPATCKWIKFNPDQSGFYRVAYTPDYLRHLVAPISTQILSPIDRLGIQNDIVALSKAGVLHLDMMLEILQAYTNETNYIVWGGISSNVEEIWSLINSDPEIAPKFKEFAKRLFTRQGEELGWDPKPQDTHLTSMLRSMMLRNLGRYGHEGIIAGARERFARFRADMNAVSPDLRGTLYSINVKYGGKDEWEAVLNILHTSDLNEERIRAMAHLGASTDPSLLQQTLNLVLSPEVRPQDTAYILAGLAANPLAKESVWVFFKDHFDEFVSRYGKGGFLMGRIIKTCSEGFASEEKATEIADFFKDHPVPSATRAISQAIETIKLNAAWISRERGYVKSWLDGHGY